MGVIPVKPDILLSPADREVVDLAYHLWLARGFRGGSPEDGLLTAVQEVGTKTPARPFLVQKRNLMQVNFIRSKR